MKKFWPTRQAHRNRDIEPVTDLDALIAEPVPFRYNGKIHNIKPIALDEFLKFTNAQANLMDAIKKDDVKLTADDLAGRYHSVISSLCDTISLDDVRNMSQPQVAALYQLVIDQVTGQVNTGDGKKKRMKIPLYQSAPEVPLSSQSVPNISVGQSNKP